VESWPRRFGIRLREELNVVNGIVAVGGLPFGAAGLVANGWLQVGLLAACGVITVPIIGHAFWKSWPPKHSTAESRAGEQILLGDLVSIDPPPPVLGIVGTKKVGKTTLQDTFMQKIDTRQGVEETRKITCHIAPIIHQPKAEYWAIIDGKGEELSQQFEVLNRAQILCVLIDHNMVSDAVVLNEDRLEKHREDGEQLRSHLVNQWESKLPSHKLPVHILLNKRDTWEKLSAVNKAHLRDLLKNEEAAWSKMQYVAKVITAEHSNSQAGDMVQLARALHALWSTRTAVK